MVFTHVTYARSLSVHRRSSGIGRQTLGSSVVSLVAEFDFREQTTHSEWCSSSNLKKLSFTINIRRAVARRIALRRFAFVSSTVLSVRKAAASFGLVK